MMTRKQKLLFWRLRSILLRSGREWEEVKRLSYGEATDAVRGLPRAA